MHPTVQQPPPQQKAHWKTLVLTRLEVITDAWEVTKTGAGRIAEWVLFGCMIVNILEILPDLHVSSALSNSVLATQAVTLDIAGFSLATMAEQARANGEKKAARKATWTGYFLIGLMMVTISLVTIGLLWPHTKTSTDMAEKGLILVRVIMTVIYSHVVHSLRNVGADAPLGQSMQSPPSATHVPNVLALLQEQEAQRQSQLDALVQEQRAHAVEVQQQVHSLTEVHCEIQQQVHSLIEVHREVQQQVYLLKSELAMKAKDELVEPLQSEPDEQRQPAHPAPRKAHRTQAVTRKLTPLEQRQKPLDLLPVARQRRQLVYACLDADVKTTLEAMMAEGQRQGVSLSKALVSKYRSDYRREHGLSEPAQVHSVQVHMDDAEPYTIEPIESVEPDGSEGVS